MKMSNLSLLALLALAFAFADGTEGQSLLAKTSPINCCPIGKFCCGTSCLKSSLKPVVRCAGPPACCPKPPPPPPPPQDCCPAGTFCCGSSCEAEELRPMILCATLPDCSRTCLPPPVVDPCTEEPRVVGNCRAAIPRWSFIKKTGTCERFIYGGCGGTKNNFETEESCKKTCKVVEEPVPLDCCTKDEFCCGGGCLPLSQAPFTTCLPGVSCCNVATPVPITRDCVCPFVYKPVCSQGTGKEYGNACEASCANDAGPFVDGPCTPPELHKDVETIFRR